MVPILESKCTLFNTVVEKLKLLATFNETVTKRNTLTEVNIR